MTESSEPNWLVYGRVRFCNSGEVVPLNLKTDAEKENYVKNKTTEVCTITASVIRTYLTNRRMTQKIFSEKTNISKWRLMRILQGNYGGIRLSDFAAIQCEIHGENDKATRRVLIEKMKKQ